MAEIELSILQQQCLDCRIPDADTLTREIAAWDTSAMESRPPSTGAFLSPMRAKNSNDSIPHFQRDEVLVVVASEQKACGSTNPLNVGYRGFCALRRKWLAKRNWSWWQWTKRA